MINDLRWFEDRHNFTLSIQDCCIHGFTQGSFTCKEGQISPSPDHSFSSSQFRNHLFCLCLKERRYINRVRLETSDMSSVGEVIYVSILEILWVQNMLYRRKNFKASIVIIDYIESDVQISITISLDHYWTEGSGVKGFLSLYISLDINTRPRCGSETRETAH